MDSAALVAVLPHRYTPPRLRGNRVVLAVSSLVSKTGAFRMNTQPRFSQLRGSRCFMRVAAWGIGLGFAIVLVVGAICFAQPPGGHVVDKATPSGQLMALSAELPDGRQQITLIDPRTRVMSVYQIDRASGEISLKSVRSVHWDLLMDEFNS